MRQNARAEGNDHPTVRGFQKNLAVVVGINAYGNGVSRLVNAVNDATAVGNTLRRHGFEVWEYLDDKATLWSLSQELMEQLLPKACPDRLVFYFVPVR